MSAAETITREIRRVVREESLTLDDVRRVVREELERHDEAKFDRLAELSKKPGKLTEAEALALRDYLRAHPDLKADLRWRRGQTRRPRRSTVARWWTAKLGRPEPELIALLEGDGDEATESGPPDREGAAV